MANPGMYGRLGKVPRRTQSNRTTKSPTDTANPGEIASGGRTYSYDEGTTGTTTHDWLIPTGTQSGDRIWVAIHIMNNGSYADIDTMPTGYTTLWDLQDNTVDHCQYYVFYKDASGSEQDTTFTTTTDAGVSAVFWRTKANGVTFEAPSIGTVSTDEAGGVGDGVDPNPVSPGTAGDYAVYTVTHSNKGAYAAPATDYTEVGYSVADNVARRPRTFVQQRSVTIATSEDPGEIDWSDTAGFRQYRTLTIALRLDVGTPPLATGDHTHVEADVTDLDHWTEADHDALDHTGLTGVGGSGDVTVAKAGTEVGTRGRINFIEGTDITLTVTDDSGNDEIDVTVTSTASGGGGGGLAVPLRHVYLAERLSSESSHTDDIFWSDAPGVTGTEVTGDGSATASWSNDFGMLVLDISGTGGSGAREPIARAWSLTPTGTPVTLETHFTIYTNQSPSGHIPAVMLGFSDGTAAGDDVACVYSYLGMAGVLEAHGTFNAMGFSGFNDTILTARLDVWQRIVYSAANTFQMQVAVVGRQPNSAPFGWSAGGMGTLSKTLDPTHFWVGAANTSATAVKVAWDYVRVYESDLSV